MKIEGSQSSYALKSQAAALNKTVSHADQAASNFTALLNQVGDQQKTGDYSPSAIDSSSLFNMDGEQKDNRGGILV